MDYGPDDRRCYLDVVPTPGGAIVYGGQTEHGSFISYWNNGELPGHWATIADSGNSIELRSNSGIEI